MSASILIAEDEAINALHLRLTLERDGYRVFEPVMKGQSAVEAALKFRPDIILMDIYLADQIDGIQAVKQIHSIVKIPVIYLTASMDPSTRARAESTTYSAYLPKPVTGAQVSSAVAGVLSSLYRQDASPHGI